MLLSRSRSISAALMRNRSDVMALFDQLLRGRIAPGARVLDAGCGGGRNLDFLLRQGYEVFALDENPGAIAAVRDLARRLAPRLPAANFRCEPLEANGFSDHAADVVISSAVLHFARDEAHFRAMLLGSWRLLAPGGLFFCRLASSIGMEGFAQAAVPLGDRRFLLPDGSERFPSTRSPTCSAGRPSSAAAWSIPSRPRWCRSSGV